MRHHCAFARLFWKALKPMDANDHHAAIGRLELSQGGAARLIGVNARTSRRWALGDVPLPEPGVRLLCTCERFAALRNRPAADTASRERGPITMGQKCIFGRRATGRPGVAEEKTP